MIVMRLDTEPFARYGPVSSSIIVLPYEDMQTTLRDWSNARRQTRDAGREVADIRLVDDNIHLTLHSLHLFLTMAHHDAVGFDASGHLC